MAKEFCRWACNSARQMRIKFFKDRLKYFENEIKVYQELKNEDEKLLEKELKKECNCGVNK